MAQGRLIYGGSFNPVHSGHIRLALEALNFLRGHVAGAEFLPSAHPPHKQGQPLLPFELRNRMLAAAISGIAGLSVNVMEARMPAPSYTVATLAALKENPESLYFLIGSSDYLLLNEWHEGLILPEYCNFVVVPRGVYGREEFAKDTQKWWPGSSLPEAGPTDECLGEGGWHIRLPQGTCAYLLPAPHLTISSTRIRRMWLCHRNLDLLIPEAALKILNSEASLARSCWQEKKCSM